MCGGGFRRPSDGRIGNKVGFRRVILRKIVVLPVSIFVILKNIDGALLRKSRIRPSPKEKETNQSSCEEENNSAYHAA